MLEALVLNWFEYVSCGLSKYALVKDSVRVSASRVARNSSRISMSLLQVNRRVDGAGRNEEKRAEHEGRQTEKNTETCRQLSLHRQTAR